MKLKMLLATTAASLVLSAGMAFAGPAIVEQMDTTTLVPPGVTATVDKIDNLILELSA